MTNDYNELEIIYQDDDLIAINKPHGLLVHRSRMAHDAKVFAVQQLRNMIGQHVYPVHRLDRKTSGVLLFAKNPSANQHYQQLFRERKVYKEYRAIVRGYMAESGTIDYPLIENDRVQEAITHYKLLSQHEINMASGGHLTSRYSIVELMPESGRFHQLRKHLAHIFHPIIGDRPHGCNKQNKLWKENFALHTMMLHAATIRIQHSDQTLLTINAEPSTEFKRVVSILTGQ